MISIPYLICSILSFVPAIVCHEACHGFAAYKLGDPTAKRAGRLSFNPLKHIDPFGTVIMPLLLMAMNMPVFGYAKPVPYNPAYFKDPRKGDLIVGLAGPAANLVLAVLGAVVYTLVMLVLPVSALAGALCDRLGYSGGMAALGLGLLSLVAAGMAAHRCRKGRKRE